MRLIPARKTFEKEFKSNVQHTHDFGAELHQPHAVLCNTGNLTSAGTTSENLITFNTQTDLEQFTHSTSTNPSRVYANRTGDYIILVTLDVVASAPNKHIVAWLKRNGSNVTNSATILECPLSGEAYLSLMFYSELNAGDYLEIAWCSRDDASLALVATAAAANPTTPVAPSVEIIITRKSN